MDNVTHTLVGATLARAAFGRSGRGTMAALILASNAPDVDIVAATRGALSYLAWHRGPTHGVLGVLGLGVLVGLIVWYAEGARGSRLERDRPRASLRTLVVASTLGVLGHVLMDLPTSYGTRLLSPFDWHWYAVDLMPIVDVYLLVILATGLWLGRHRPASTRRAQALVVLTLMLLNYGVRTLGHRQALSAATSALGPLLPPPCPDAVTPRLLDWWPREELTWRRERAVRRCLVEIAAIPTFFTPLRWHVIARLSDSYHTFDIGLLDSRLRAPSTADELGAPWRQTQRHPDQWTPATLQAARGQLGQTFVDFARFPATRSVLDDENRTTVRWTDLRFARAARPAPLRERGNAFFSAVVVVGPSGRIESEHLGE